MKGAYPRIVVEPPGPKAKSILERDRRVLMQSFTRWYPLVVKRCYDFLVEDVDGNVYIDLNSGIAVLNVGHAHPAVVEAAIRQVQRFTHYSLTDFAYEEAVKLAEKLVEITPGEGEKRVFFCNSGAEAVEGSLKVARGHFRGSRPYIVAFAGSFHGRTYGALSLTSSKPVQRRWLGPFLPGVFHVPYPYCYRCPFKLEYPDCGIWCVDFIEEWLFRKYVPPEEVAAIVFEPMAGEGGYIVPPPEFFPRLHKLAEEYGILLVDDEVQAGMGRTGKWFAIEHWGITPDIIAMAKALAGGLPLGAIVGRSDVMDLPPGSHASTFGGNPVSCAAALAVIEVIEKGDLLANAEKRGREARKFFDDLAEEVEVIGDVRGLGLMIGVELVKSRETKEPYPELLKKVLTKAFKRGVLAIGAGISVLRIAPPLSITSDALSAALEILRECLKESIKELS